jgi:endonuclease/exonuclease/phosphatase family metal-dependent hydrolase
MTYNLHQGFNTDGALDIEALARVIEASGADVIALQEVTRSYVTNGSLDMLPWLSQRLGMPYYWGPTDPPQWGNALLSRYPLLEVNHLPLPPDSLNLHRGYIDAVIDLGGGRVRLIATHLHHLDNGSEIRQTQVETLLAAWSGSPNTLIVGDLNAVPDDPEMQDLLEAGFLESASSLNHPAPSTYYADNPERQIDYIWLTPDLQPENIFIPQSSASDHLPVVVDVRLP